MEVGKGRGGVNNTRQKAFLDQLVRFSLGIIYVVIGSFPAAVMEQGGGLFRVLSKGYRKPQLDR